MRISDWSSDVCSSDLGTKRADAVIGAPIAHHAHRAHRQQHRKGLPYRVVKSRLADFLQIDGVGLAQYVAALLGHLTRNTDGEAGAGERVPSDKGFRKAEFPAKLAHPVLEQRSEEHTSELQSLMHTQ